jgi:hypothetical protein
MKRIFCIGVAAGCFASAAYAQTIADFARQERERKERDKVQSKVTITNDSVKGGTSTAPPADTKSQQPAADTKQAASVTGKTAGPTDNKGRDEKWWRETFGKAREDLKRSEDRMRVIQLELNQANHDLLTRSDIYNREAVIGAQIKGLNDEMESERAKSAKAQGQLDQLEEELRKSNGLPGWAR